MINDFTPPLPLDIGARRAWDAIADEIHHQGRWTTVDHHMLALFCQTLVLYQAAKAEVDEHGILVEGRSKRERVRNPALTPLGQFRSDLIRLAKAVPLRNTAITADEQELDRFLELATAGE